MTERDDDARSLDPADHHLGGEVIDLALGHVGGARRAEMAVHLLACPPCRAEYDEMVAALDLVVPAAPAVQPPLGFDERTLARMGVGGAGGSVPAESRSRRWWVPVGAAAVLVVVALAVGAWLASGDASAPADAQVAVLATGDGRDVGTATRTEVDGDPVLVVGLVTGGAEASYTCRMRFADGSTLDTEPWAVAPGAAWLVSLPDDRGDVEDVALLATDDGAVWSTAAFRS